MTRQKKLIIPILRSCNYANEIPNATNILLLELLIIISLFIFLKHGYKNISQSYYTYYSQKK